MRGDRVELGVAGAELVRAGAVALAQAAFAFRVGHVQIIQAVRSVGVLEDGFHPLPAGARVGGKIQRDGIAGTQQIFDMPTHHST